MKKAALTVAGVVFSVVAALHFYRFYKAIEVTFNHQVIPLQWSLYGGIVTAALALWMFIATKR